MAKICFLVLLAIFSSTLDAIAHERSSVVQVGPEDGVIKLHKIKIGVPARLDFGTGWCLDPECSLVVSNYHVAMLMGSPFKIGGEKVVKRYLATGPGDEGAVWIQWRQKSLAPPLKLVPSRDIAIFRLQRPLASTHKEIHGITFYAGQLQEDETVNVYAYPAGGKLAIFPGKFVRELADGILEFEVQKSNTGKAIGPGVSGGVIVNHENQAVGLVWGIEKGDTLLQAIPIWSLADFVEKVEPEVYAKLVRGGIYRPVAPLSADTAAESDFIDRDVEVSEGGITPKSILPDSYLEYEPHKAIPALALDSAGVLQRRTEEPISVQILRHQAQKMVEDMTNFVAIQTLQFGGGQTSETRSQDEVRVAYGQQVFRKWPDGKNEMSQLPYPKSDPGVVIGDEWSTLPNRVGSNLKLRIEPVGVQDIDGHKMEVFRYEASVEDHACEFRSISDYILWQHEWSGAVECTGEVWTDENLNIVRITENEELPAQKTKWQNLHIVVTYGWVEEQAAEPRLVPTNILLQAEYSNDGNTYWCRGTFSNYRMFTSNVRIGFTK